MRALRALVVFMAVLIAIGLGLVAYGVILRLADRGGERPSGFGEVALDLPAGCTLAEARAEDGFLIVRAEGPPERGCQQVLLIGLDDGALLGRVRAEPAP